MADEEVVEGFPFKLKFAGQTFTIHPFTVGQLEALHVGVVVEDGKSPKEDVERLWVRNKAILVAALSEDHGHITLEHLNKMRLGSLKVMNEAVNKILEVAGIIKKKDSVATGVIPGEAVAPVEGSTGGQ